MIQQRQAFEKHFGPAGAGKGLPTWLGSGFHGMVGKGKGRQDWRLEDGALTLRCLLDGLLLPAHLDQGQPPLIAFDGGEAFALEALEALYYELVQATPEEVLDLERSYFRLLRRAGDFLHGKA